MGSDEKHQKKNISAIKEECDGFKHSLLIDMPRYGIAVFEFNATKLESKKSLQ